MRITEINAVAARGSGAELYERFGGDAEELTTRLRDDEANSDLLRAVERYLGAERQVQEADAEGDNRQAADIVLTGDSATAFAAADSGVAAAVHDAEGALADRLDAASDAEVPPLVPIALGALAAGAAAAGVLARARRYR